MDKDQTDDGKEDRGRKSDQKRSQPDPAHVLKPGIEPDPCHGDEDEKLSQIIDILDDPLPLRNRNEGALVSNGSENR